MTTQTRKPRRAGDIYRYDGQADIWRGRYQLIERTAPSTWIVERLADADDITEAIVAFWADQEARHANGAYKHPWQSYEDALFAELEQRAALAGTRSTIKFISASRYAEYF